jgi:hypothetical protein
MGCTKLKDFCTAKETTEIAYKWKNPLGVIHPTWDYYPEYTKNSKH